MAEKARSALTEPLHLERPTWSGSSAEHRQRRSVPREPSTWLPLHQLKSGRSGSGPDGVAQKASFGEGTRRLLDDVLEFIQPFRKPRQIGNECPYLLHGPVDLDLDISS